jgi:hypothetical protein
MILKSGNRFSGKIMPKENYTMRLIPQAGSISEMAGAMSDPPGLAETIRVTAKRP